jgi:predicted amidophosphoribosyltransferase
VSAAPADGSGHGAAVSAFAYAAPVDAALKALKFGGDRAAARMLGTLLAMAVTSAVTAGRLVLPDLLLPVPLHPRRLAERGFNQAGLIARHAGAWLRRPVRDDWLRRERSTLAQTALHAAERRRNVAGAFAATPRASAALRAGPTLRAGRTLRAGMALRVALIDDVMTTGATLEAAREALLQAGPVEVQRWSVATPMPSHSTSPT